MQSRDGLDMDAVADLADRAWQYALDGIVLAPASMEHLLRAVFAALLGNKNRAIAAAGQNAGWLPGQCQAMTKPLRGISEDGKGVVLKALGACAQTCQRRNRWFMTPGPGVLADGR